jgi:hypothetical protein
VAPVNSTKEPLLFEVPYRLYSRLARVSALMQAVRSALASNRLARSSAAANVPWARFSACPTEAGVGSRPGILGGAHWRRRNQRQANHHGKSPPSPVSAFHVSLRQKAAQYVRGAKSFPRIEVAQIRRCLALLGRHQHVIPAKEVVLTADQNVMIVLGAVVFQPDRTAVPAISLGDRP